MIIHWGGQSELSFTPAAVWRKKITSEILFFRKHYLPESFQRIRRANIIQACWRIFSLGVTIPFSGKNKKREIAKREKYRVVFDLYKNVRPHSLPKET
jgi:hypothetical protein